MDKFVRHRQPIINIENVPEAFGTNFSGATVFLNPGYLDSSIYARYIMYFAHHSGTFIRIATSNNPFSGWAFPNLEILKIGKFNEFHDHIASPEVFLDHESKTLNLFFHSRINGSREQQTFLAKSKDGVKFEFTPMESFLPFYLRVSVHNGKVFGVTKGGNLFSHPGGNFSRDWKYLGNMDSPDSKLERLNYFNDVGNIRHAHIISYKENLLVFYTRLGEAPEQIYARLINFGSDNNLIEFSEQIEIMQPRLPFECQSAPLKESQPGPSEIFERAFRDPFVFMEKDVKLLFYSYGGESGIGVCEIDLDSMLSRITKEPEID
jgi:hypothetical protein